MNKLSEEFSSKILFNFSVLPGSSSGSGPAGGPAAIASLASAASAAQAVKKAGSLLKGVLGAGVQVVKAFDRVIDKAIDDSAKQEIGRAHV